MIFGKSVHFGAYQPRIMRKNALKSSRQQPFFPYKNKIKNHPTLKANEKKNKPPQQQQQQSHRMRIRNLKIPEVRGKLLKWQFGT